MLNTPSPSLEQNLIGGHAVVIHVNISPVLLCFMKKWPLGLGPNRTLLCSKANVIEHRFNNLISKLSELRVVLVSITPTPLGSHALYRG